MRSLAASAHWGLCSERLAERRRGAPDARWLIGTKKKRKEEKKKKKVLLLSSIRVPAWREKGKDVLRTRPSSTLTDTGPEETHLHPIIQSITTQLQQTYTNT